MKDFFFLYRTSKTIERSLIHQNVYRQSNNFLYLYRIPYEFGIRWSCIYTYNRIVSNSTAAGVGEIGYFIAIRILSKSPAAGHNNPLICIPRARLPGAEQTRVTRLSLSRKKTTERIPRARCLLSASGINCVFDPILSKNMPMYKYIYIR